MSEYKAAGVDIEAAAHTVDLIKDAVRQTYTPDVLADVGSFGGLFALTDLPENPVLVASTDGVGTKVELAARLGRLRGLGHDIVNHCVNDILVQNARPLFFLDYVASSKLEPETSAEIVIGIAEACQAVGCALIGGELAEMPGVYADGALDLVGTVVGLVDRGTLLPRKDDMVAGDMLIGLPSSGPHTNGYTLIRKLIEDRDIEAAMEPNGPSLAQALLTPHRSYVAEIDAILNAELELKGMAHITGGGIMDNLPRILPGNLAAKIHLAEEQIPALFRQLWAWSEMELNEAFQVFNMGVGMVLVVGEGSAEKILEIVPEAFEIGSLVPSDIKNNRIEIDLTLA